MAPISICCGVILPSIRSFYKWCHTQPRKECGYNFPFFILCCVVLFFAKVVIYHCMNAVFGKVARFIRIVQLKPFVEPVSDSLFHSWEKLFSPLLIQGGSSGENEVLLSLLSIWLRKRYESGWEWIKIYISRKKRYESPMYYWSDADFVPNLV